MNERPLAIVTGASAGIGEALACEAAADGHDLLLVARRRDRLEALAAELKPTTTCHVLTLDLAERDAGERLVALLQTEGLSADVLVNNAGYGRSGRFVEGERERELGMIDLNVRALVDLTHRLLPGMLERGSGGILNVASTAAFLPGPKLAVYYASKAFVLSFSEALWQETRGTGISVSALCPGPTTSEFGGVAGMDRSRLFKSAPKMSAEDVARIGWQGFRKGKRVVVPGLTNKVGALLSRLGPRTLTLPMVSFLQSDAD